jgi:hypothetical protein
MKTSTQRRRQRKRDLFRRQFYSDERVRFIQTLPCEVTGKVRSVGAIHNAHTRSRGAGGDYKTIVPLQFLVHKDFDEMPEEKFEEKYKRTKQSVRDRANYYQELWEDINDD